MAQIACLASTRELTERVDGRLDKAVPDALSLPPAPPASLPSAASHAPACDASAANARRAAVAVGRASGATVRHAKSSDAKGKGTRGPTTGSKSLRARCTKICKGRICESTEASSNEPLASRGGWSGPTPVLTEYQKGQSVCGKSQIRDASQGKNGVGGG